MVKDLMKVSLKKYLFTPAVDSLNENEQFQYGLSNIDGVNLDFFDKIFFIILRGLGLETKISIVKTLLILIFLIKIDITLFI